ncbi:MAG TPA: ABC transporter permease [Thermomicrobiales bacterium]|nr:ABC transporter permease [Thermomicrobiales bacterium]
MSAPTLPAPDLETSGPWPQVLRGVEPILQALLAIAAAIAICSVVLVATGFSPVETWREFIERTLLRPAGIQESIARATPLLIAGVGVLVAARAGLWNIGVDGQVLVGAMAAAVVGHSLAGSPALAIWIGAFAAAGIAGGLWIVVPAVLRARWGINEIVTTIMFNYVAVSLTSWLVKGLLRDESLVTSQTPLIPRETRLPLLGDTRIHAGLFVAVIIWIAAAWWLGRSVWGFEMRSVGASPRAARHAMIPVGGIVVGALLASGTVAALAGANDVLATKGTFQAEWNPEYGLSAFALVFLARRSVAGLIPAALFLGMLSYGADVMPRAAGVPSMFFQFFEGVLLIVLAVLHWRPWQRFGWFPT